MNQNQPRAMAEFGFMQVGVTDRPEFRNWKDRRTPWAKKALFYVLIALIPIVIFGLLLYVARHS
jgi:hypothetical protein